MLRLIQCSRQIGLTASKLLLNQAKSTNPIKIASIPAAKLMQNQIISKRFYSAFDINTKVVKDVILFKFENPNFFRIINFFAISQFVFWNYLSYFAYTTLRDAPPSTDKNDSWYQKLPNLGENKYRNTITIFCFLVGYGILTVAWTYTLRSVRFLILRKGGETASLVTYTPFGKNRILEVPIKNISAENSRESAKSTLPLKVKNKSLFYVLDMRGEFKNPRLYDYTVGLKRTLK